jgi:hypothetical protein
MTTFQEFFNHADKDRKKHLTTKDIGLHGANAATITKDKPKNDLLISTEAALRASTTPDVTSLLPHSLLKNQTRILLPRTNTQIQFRCGNDKDKCMNYE